MLFLSTLSLTCLARVEEAFEASSPLENLLQQAEHFREEEELGDSELRQLQQARGNKLKRMRFYIWNKQKPYLFNSKETVEVHADRWKKKRLTLGAEVIDPLLGETSKIFDPSLKTIIAIHGYTASIPGGGLDLFLDAHNVNGDFDDYNFIGLDWRDLAAHQLPGNGYDIPADNVYFAGARAAEMLMSLIGKDSPAYDKIHLIGHSLGAHLAGNMARSLETQTGKKIQRITALDPAGPKFVDDKDTKYALTKNDAEYIDAVHTDSALNKPFVIRGKMGDARPDVAHLNFYMNGGHTQPGCKASAGVCSHQRSWHYYGEAMKNPNAFTGFQCNLIPDAKKGWHKPKDQGCLKMQISDKANSVVLGEVYDGRPTGNYVIRTNKKEPFSDPSWNNQ